MKPGSQVQTREWPRIEGIFRGQVTRVGGWRWEAPADLLRHAGIGQVLRHRQMGPVRRELHVLMWNPCDFRLHPLRTPHTSQVVVDEVAALALLGIIRCGDVAQLIPEDGYRARHGPIQPCRLHSDFLYGSLCRRDDLSG